MTIVLFNNNNSYLTVANSPKVASTTKHIAIKYHHLRSFVADSSVVIDLIYTSEQIADILTKSFSCMTEEAMEGSINIVHKFISILLCFHLQGECENLRF